MAKRSSKTTTNNSNRIEFSIPDRYAPNMRMWKTETGDEQIEIKFSVKRYWVVSLLKGLKTIEVDVALFAGLVAFSKLFEYGLGRFLRDGAKASEELKDNDGDKYTRKFTKAERLADAEANATKKLDSLYGHRAMGSRQTSVSVAVNEMRIAAMTHCLNNLQDANGDRYKRNTVPSTVAKGDTVASIASALVGIGATKEAASKLSEVAETIAKLKEGLTANV